MHLDGDDVKDEKSPARAFSEYHTLFMLLDLNPQAYAQLAIYMGPIWDLYGYPDGECDRAPYGPIWTGPCRRSRGGSRIS